MKLVKGFLLGGIVTMLSCGAVWAQPIEQLPAETHFAVKFNKVGQLGGKIDAFVRAAGMEQLFMMTGNSTNPLDSLKKELGVDKGVDLNGDGAVAMIDPKLTGESEDKSTVLVIPVSDYQAFLGNFADAKTDGKVTTANRPNGEPIYIAQSGKYALIGFVPATVGLKAGLKVDGASSKKLDSQDVAVLFNFAGFRAKATETLKGELEKALADIDRDATDNKDDAQTVQMKKVAATQGMSIPLAFVRDAKFAVVGMNISAEGLSSSSVAEFLPESYTGGLVSKVQNSNSTLVSGLPDKKYLMWGGAALNAPAVTQAVDEFLAPIVAEMAKTKDGQKAGEAQAAIKSLMEATKGMSMGLVQPTDAKSGFFNGLAVYTGDAAKIKAGTRSLLLVMDTLSKAIEPGGKEKSTYKADAKTIEGVSFDQIEVTAAEPTTPEEAEAQAMRVRVMGEKPVTLYGQVNDSAVLTTVNMDDAAVAESVNAVKAKNESINKLAQVQAVSNMLPKNRVAEGYIQLDSVLSSASSMAGMMGFPIELKFPEDLPPIGVALSTEGNSVQADGFMSVKIFKAITDAYKAMMRQFAPQMQPPAQPQPGLQ